MRVPYWGVWPGQPYQSTDSVKLPCPLPNGLGPQPGGDATIQPAFSTRSMEVIFSPSIAPVTLTLVPAWGTSLACSATS